MIEATSMSEPTITATATTGSDPDRGSRWRTVGRIAFVVGALGFAAFWIWALFFASKEPVNRIEDEVWQQRAEQICVAADERRVALADFRTMEEATPALVREKADIVDAATDIIEQMLDDVVAQPPSDAKGRSLIPLWEADYRTYLADRRAFSETLREGGENVPFYETEAGGIPISEKLETFAADNHMASCAPPRDLTR
jgi:hypothetical protein